MLGSARNQQLLHNFLQRFYRAPLGTPSLIASLLWYRNVGPCYGTLAGEAFHVLTRQFTMTQTLYDTLDKHANTTRTELAQCRSSSLLNME